MARRFWEKRRRNIQPWYLRQRRDSDVIISASPEFLLEPVVTGYLHCALIASKVDPKTGVYDGKNCYGEEKARHFRARYGDKRIDNFFSDDYADMPLMRAAENAFLVKGDTIMKAEL
jgi:phosphoserine phosphatase